MSGLPKHILDSHFSRARRDECIKIKRRKKTWLREEISRLWRKMKSNNRKGWELNCWSITSRFDIIFEEKIFKSLITYLFLYFFNHVLNFILIFSVTSFIPLSFFPSLSLFHHSEREKSQGFKTLCNSCFENLDHESWWEECIIVGGLCILEIKPVRLKRGGWREEEWILIQVIY